MKNKNNKKISKEEWLIKNRINIIRKDGVRVGEKSADIIIADVNTRKVKEVRGFKE